MNGFELLSEARAALIARFLVAAIVPADCVAYGNVKFTPPTDKTWCKVTFMPTQAVPVTLGDTGADQVDGFLQVDINTLEGKGEAPAQALFDVLNLYFSTGLRLKYVDTTVVIRSCGRSPGRNVNSYYTVTATIYFYTQIHRGSLDALSELEEAVAELRTFTET